MKAKSPSSSAILHINTAFACVTAAVVDLSKRVAEGEFEVPTASKGSIDSPLMLRAREMRSSFLDNLGLGDSLEKKNIEIKEFKMSLRLKDRLLVEQTELREASVRHLDVLRVDLTKRLTLEEEGRFGRVTAAPSGAFGAPLSAVGGDASSADVISLSSYTNSLFSLSPA